MATGFTYCATDLHVWRVPNPDESDHSEVLGKGSFGAVYRGVNKANGESVAIKTFKTTAQQLREFEILQQLSHPNIVKLLSVENEQCYCLKCLDKNAQTCGRPLGQVFVMEYCVFGSLYSILESPENSMGLSESEFLLLLQDLRSALMYLHLKNVVHRDIKPPNILKTVQNNGRVAYKFCDFGGAKIVEEDGEFMSLVGTPEYMHPDVYKRAMLNGSHDKFSSTTDLWPLAVTLYQALTGELAFRVVGGRSNKNLMYTIRAGKPRGVISGVQSQPNEKIEWKYSLSKHECRLSSGLRQPVVELLAGMLDCSKDAAGGIASFEQFFEAAQNKILSKKKLIIFCPHICIAGTTELSVFLNDEESFNSFCKAAENQLRAEIIETTHPNRYSPGKLPILFMDERGQKLTVDNFSVAKLYSLSPDGVTPTVFAYLLCPDVVSRIRSLSSWDMKSLPKNMVFTRDVIDIHGDVETAKTCSAVAHWMLRDMDATRLFAKRLHDSVNILKLFIDTQASSLQTSFVKDKELWTAMQRNLLLLEMLMNQSTVHTGADGTVKHLISAKTNSAAEITSSVLQIETNLAKFRDAANQCNKSLATAEREIANFSQTNNCTTAKEDTEFLIQRIAAISKIMELFNRDVKQKDKGRSLNPLEIGYHNAHKRQLSGHWDAILSKWSPENGDTNKCLKFVQQQLWPCLKELEELLPLLAPPKLEQSIPSLHDMIKAFDGALEKILRNCDQHVSNMVQCGTARTSAFACANVSSTTISEHMSYAKPTETSIETEIVQLLTIGTFTSKIQFKNGLDEKRWLEMLQNAHSLNEQVHHSLELSKQFHATVSKTT